MRVALFVPCYVDQLRPRIGLAALDLLEAGGLRPHVLSAPACCGQPFLTAGERSSAREFADQFALESDGFDAIVLPSGSCAATLRVHLPHLLDESKRPLANRVFEWTDFVVRHGVLPESRLPFPENVGFHASCHALRELRQGNPSESRQPRRTDPALHLLDSVPELRRVSLRREDECCGFGGVFAVEEEAVSARMGRDRVSDHVAAGARVVTSTDVSCLLHMEGIARRRDAPLRVLHVAEILAESILGPGWLAENDPDREARSAARGQHDGAR